MYLRTTDLIIKTVEAFSGGRLITVFYFDIKTSGRLTVGNLCTKIFLNSPTDWGAEKPWWGCMWTSGELFFLLASQSVSYRCRWVPPAHLNTQQRPKLCSECSTQVLFFPPLLKWDSFQPVFCINRAHEISFSLYSVYLPLIAWSVMIFEFMVRF